MAKKVQTPIRVDLRSRISNVDTWAYSGKWVLVKSSNVKAIKYDVKLWKLYVRFKGGDIYIYNMAPPKLAKDMFLSPSMGKFVWAKLRDKLPTDGPL